MLFILIQCLKNTLFYYAGLRTEILPAALSFFGDERIHSTGRQGLLTALKAAWMVWGEWVCKFGSRSISMVIYLY